MLNDDETLHDDVFYALYEFYPGPHPLPNLREFACWDVYPPPTMALFMPPSLLRASVDPSDIPTTTYFLTGVAQRCGSLRELEVHASLGYRMSTEILELVSETVCALPQLQKLNVGFMHLEPDALEHIATLPKLQNLEMGIRDCVCDTLRTSVKRRRLFPSLSKLSVTVPVSQKASLPTLLRVIPYERLAQLHISIEVRDDEEADWGSQVPMPGRKTYLHEIAECIAKMTALQKLSFGIAKELRAVNDLTFTDDMLAPLLSLKQMQSMSLSHLPTNLSPGMLQQIAAAWPDIRSLDFTCPGGSRFNVEDLLPLAKCEHLTTLGVLIDGDVDIAVLENRPLPGQSTSKLRSLELGRSHLPNPAHLAAFLYGAFPSARLGPDYMIKRPQHWRKDYEVDSMVKVNSFLDAFAKTKKLEGSSALGSLRPQYGRGMVCPGSDYTAKDIVAGVRLGLDELLEE